MIPDKYGNLSIPSLVLVAPDENIFVGRSAQNHPERYSSKNIIISSVKRLIGRHGETGWAGWKSYPQEVSAFIFAELVRQAGIYLGENINEAQEFGSKLPWYSTTGAPWDKIRNLETVVAFAAQMEAECITSLHRHRLRGRIKTLLFTTFGSDFLNACVETGQNPISTIREE